MDNQEQKPIMKTEGGEQLYGIEEAADAKMRLKKAEERDFKIAEALKRGATFEEIQKIQKDFDNAEDENTDEKK